MTSIRSPFNACAPTARHLLLSAFLIFGSIVCIGGRTAFAADVNVDSLHWAQWDSAFVESDTDPAVRYSFYAYRSIAVPHPEIYLRADSVFLDIIAGIPGSRSAYRGADVRNLDFFRSLKQRERKGPAFSIAFWAPELDSIDDRTVVPDHISWLDRRMPSAAVLLHGPVYRLSTIEAAALRYAQYRRMGASADSVYVIIDTSGTGYYVVGKNIYVPTSLSPVADPARIIPALVFNERAVYYPLMGRDDRPDAPRLASLVDRLAPAALPALRGLESTYVEKLKQVASLPDGVSQRMATLLASGADDVTDSAVAAAWGTPPANSQNEIALLVRGMSERVTQWCDRLSAKSAAFAAIAWGQPFARAAQPLTTAYLHACGRPVDPRDSTDTDMEAGGHIWSYELLQIPFDDLIRLKTGQPSSQALAMSAIMDIAGVMHYRVRLDFGQEIKPDQYWVITDDGRWQFNLGTWTQIPDSIPAAMRFAVNLRECASDNLWLGLGNNHPVGDNDVLGAAAMLTRLEAIQPGLLIRAPSAAGRWQALATYVYGLANGSMTIQSFPWGNPDRGR